MDEKSWPDRIIKAIKETWIYGNVLLNENVDVENMMRKYILTDINDLLNQLKTFYNYTWREASEYFPIDKNFGLKYSHILNDCVMFYCLIALRCLNHFKRYGMDDNHDFENILKRFSNKLYLNWNGKG